MPPALIELLDGFATGRVEPTPHRAQRENIEPL